MIRNRYMRMKTPYIFLTNFIEHFVSNLFSFFELKQHLFYLRMMILKLTI